jgi:hypothetical protein
VEKLKRENFCIAGPSLPEFSIYFCTILAFPMLWLPKEDFRATSDHSLNTKDKKAFMAKLSFEASDRCKIRYWMKNNFRLTAFLRFRQKRSFKCLVIFCVLIPHSRIK